MSSNPLNTFSATSQKTTSSMSSHSSRVSNHSHVSMHSTSSNSPHPFHSSHVANQANKSKVSSHRSNVSRQSDTSLHSNFSKSNGDSNSVEGDEAAQTAKIIQKHFNHVKVGVRLAPMSASDIQNQVKCTVEVKPPQSLIAYYPESGEGLLYEFDFVFEQRTPFLDIFKRIGYPTVNCFLEGYNSTIISYGASRSGKTELFFGNDEETGLITNSLKEVFTYLANAPDYISYTVVVSFWEMNNNQVFDLLNPNGIPTNTDLAATKTSTRRGKKPKIEYKVRRHPEYGVYLTNLSEVEVRSWDELEELIDSGAIVSQKYAHQRGIRWHSFMKLTLIREDAHQPELTVRSTLTFVNLKGTDRIGGMGAQGELLKQGASLNQSITALGTSIHNVVSYTKKKLSQAQSAQEAENMKKKFPKETFGMFGDSKVTALLSDSFSGNTCTTIVCSISPTEYHYLETMDALENIRVASHIPAFPQRGDVHTKAYNLQKKIQQLRSEIPEIGLAPGRPLTEKEEKLKALEAQFKELTSGVKEDTIDHLPSQIMKTLRKTRYEPERPELPPDADTRLWKKRQMQSLKYGSRHTFYFPQQYKSKDGKISTKTDWVYKGQWAGDKQEGEGTIENKTEKYSGSWKDGKYDGYGILWKKAPLKKGTSATSTSLGSSTRSTKRESIQSASRYRRAYAGNWKKGKKHGDGICYYKNGDIYEGEWKDDVRSGEGTMYYVDGSKYIGEWSNDLNNGYGVLHEANGNRYEGYFLNGKKHGSGMYYYVSQCRLYKGEWIDGVARCGEISDYNKDVDESDAEIERITGEVILIPKIGLQDYHQVLEQMKISLQNEWRLKQEQVESVEDEEIVSESEVDDQFENLLKQRMRGHDDDFTEDDPEDYTENLEGYQNHYTSSNYTNQYTNDRYTKNVQESFEGYDKDSYDAVEGSQSIHAHDSMENYYGDIQNEKSFSTDSASVIEDDANAIQEDVNVDDGSEDMDNEDSFKVGNENDLLENTSDINEDNEENVVEEVDKENLGNHKGEGDIEYIADNNVSQNEEDNENYQINCEDEDIKENNGSQKDVDEYNENEDNADEDVDEYNVNEDNADEDVDEYNVNEDSADEDDVEDDADEDNIEEDDDEIVDE